MISCSVLLDDDFQTSSYTSDDEKFVEFTSSSSREDTKQRERYRDAFQVELGNLQPDSTFNSSKSAVDVSIKVSYDVSTEPTNGETTIVFIESSEVLSLPRESDNVSMPSELMPLNFKIPSKTDFNGDRAVDGLTNGNNGGNGGGGDNGTSNFSFISEWHWILKHITGV